jgi:hypothetical protein
VFLFFPEQVLSTNYVNLHVFFAVLVVGSGSSLQSFWGLCFSLLKHLEIAIVLPWQGLYCSQASAELMIHTLDAITSAELMIVYTCLQLPLQNWWYNTHGYNFLKILLQFLYQGRALYEWLGSSQVPKSPETRSVVLPTDIYRLS